MEDIMIIVETPEETGLIIKGPRETIENKAKEQKDRLHCMLLGTVRASLLGNMLVGLTEKGVIIAGKGTIKPEQKI